MDKSQPASRKAYPTDVSDEEWAFAAPYLTLVIEEAPRRKYPLRELFNGLRYLARGGISWSMIPNDLPPWHVVFEQTQRWLDAGVFAQMVIDLNELLRLAEGRRKEPLTAILDSRTLQSTPESDAGAGYDGIEVVALTLPEAEKGHVLLPSRWVAERSVAWKPRLRRMAYDYERLPENVRSRPF